jgi:antibiotic biosynthesis monooxygenase (ABM) superfamily enzyme
MSRVQTDAINFHQSPTTFIGAGEMKKAELPSEQSVTAIFEVYVLDGRENELEKVVSDLIQAGLQHPGHLGMTALRPAGPNQPYRFISKFDRMENLRSWHESEPRLKLFNRVKELARAIESDYHPGLESWFQFSGGNTKGLPPKWKTTLLSWVAIYPTAVATSYFLKAVASTWHPLLQTLAMTLIVIPVVAYVFMPRLSVLFDRWLFRD